ncbi:carbohydrate kinase family protein [Chloroflexota bacterium]
MSAIVVGDAFVDIIVPFYGFRPGETYHRHLTTRCGGVANVAVQLARLGSKADFFGKVGKDVFGDYFRHNLERHGVTDFVVTDPENATGLCVSLSHKGGERTMIASRGANDFLRIEDVKSQLRGMCSSDILYFSGYSLVSDITANTVLHMVERCRSQKCAIYFNPGASNIITKKYRDVLKRYVDVLILNIAEAEKLSEQGKISEIAKSLSSIVRLAVITAGADGCILVRNGEIRCFKTDVIDTADTTGAGDACSAGFIHGKLRGMDDGDCARAGNQAALLWLREASARG